MTSCFRWLTLLAAVPFLTACGTDSGDNESDDESVPHLSAATLGEQTVLAVSDYLALERFAEANQRNGYRQAQMCKACHSIESAGNGTIGPALFEVFGRNVGEQAGFDYSPVMRNANFVWTPRALDAWLAQPGRFLPGNRMSFAGVFRQQDRDDLIAYLLVATTKSDVE